MLAAGEASQVCRTWTPGTLRTRTSVSGPGSLRAYEADSWGDGPPIALQRALMPLLAALGRVRGYKAS